VAPWDELVLACELNGNVPLEVINVINYLIAPALDEVKKELKPIPVPDHRFFHDPGWQGFLHGSTANFQGESLSSLFQDEITNSFEFTTRTLLRRGSDRIAAFLQWIAPYSATQGFVGYTRCDETELSIDLIFFEAGDVYYNSIALHNDPPTVEKIKITK
jgi:hypothetical protein